MNPDSTLAVTNTCPKDGVHRDGPPIARWGPIALALAIATAPPLTTFLGRCTRA